MIPRHTEAATTIEPYATHGAFGLIRAKNGSDTTICPANETFRTVLQCNIHLNRLEDKIQLAEIDDIKREGKQYDFIYSLLPLLSDSFYGNHPFSLDNTTAIKLYSDIFENYLLRLLSPTGTFYCMLQSIGRQHAVIFNENFLKPWQSKHNMNLSVHVLNKEFLPFKLGGIMEKTQQSWEKQFGWTRNVIKQKAEACMQTIPVKEEPVYLYTELVSGDKTYPSSFTLFPIYNPEKTDFLYNQSQMLNF
jgi:hypothetical protein